MSERRPGRSVKQLSLAPRILRMAPLAASAYGFEHEALSSAAGRSRMAGQSAGPLKWRELGLGAGYLGMALLALANLLGGDLLSLLYLLAAAAGFLFLHRRLLGICIWTGIALWGGIQLQAGQPASLILIGLGLGGVVLSSLKPNFTTHQQTTAASSPLMPEVLAPGAAMENRPPASESAPIAAVEVQPQLDLLDSAGAQAVHSNGDQHKAAAAATTDQRLHIHTIGHLEVWAGDQDLTRILVRHRVLGFVWLYLLTLAVHSGGRTAPRAVVIEALASKLELQHRRKTTRGWFHLLQRDFPAALTGPLVLDDHFVNFSLADCDLDLLQLKTLEASCRQAGALLPPDLQREVEQTLNGLPAGDYLTEWQHFEDAVPQQDGEPGRMVASLRLQVNGWRASLAGALANSYLARRDPERAIPFYEQAVERRPDREDLARQLIAAYMETGQTEKADRRRRAVHLSEEV
jgi:tetratricopeptide (TPR) repeat protein